MSQAEVERLWSAYKDLTPSGATEREARRTERQLEMQTFVGEHDVRCFKCGSGINDWAKTGITRRHAWAICVMCVRKPRAAAVPPANTPKNPANS